jgi:hypothetical protein
MALVVVEQSQVRAVEGTPGERVMQRPHDAALIVEACLSAGVHAALVYTDNLTPRFFDLSSGEAGMVLDKLRFFQIRLAIVCPPGRVSLSSRFREIEADDLRLFDTRDDAWRWLSRQHAR